MTPPPPPLMPAGTRVKHEHGAEGEVIESDHCAFRVLWDLVDGEDLGSDVFSRGDLPTLRVVRRVPRRRMALCR